ncbi:32429_t:CDS:1, partial [Racocetra persica]
PEDISMDKDNLKELVANENKEIPKEQEVPKKKEVFKEKLVSKENSNESLKAKRRPRPRRK